MQVNAYLFFDGRTEEAIEFYKTAIGAKPGTMMRFSDLPPGTPTMGPTPPEKIMHASFTVGDTTVMASDGRCSGAAEFKGITLSLAAKSDAEAEKLFKGLSEGGNVGMPMAPTFFASRFGIVADKFGVNWMVLCEKPMG